jgi:uncharacterized membrane protein
MLTFESSKILAGIGSILYGIPVIGVLLFLLGMQGLSEHYKDRHIYNDLSFSAVLLIISSILSLIGLHVLGILIGLVPTIWILISFILLIAVAIPCFIISFILALLAVPYIKNCFRALAERSGEPLFNTASTLIWIGAILTIIGIGFFFIWLGFIIAAIGFFTIIKAAPTSSTYSYTPQHSTYNYTTPPPNTQQPPTASSKSTFCPNCGAPVIPNATFCTNCGKQI